MLIVYAHPEPKSLNGAMKDLEISVLTSQGHVVMVSDLYEMNFHPVLGPGDFQSINDTNSFHPIREQIRGADLGYNPDIEEEHRRLVWADIVIFQVSLWWRHVPAITKHERNQSLDLHPCHRQRHSVIGVKHQIGQAFLFDLDTGRCGRVSDKSKTRQFALLTAGVQQRCFLDCRATLLPPMGLRQALPALRPA
ncbi:MAG: NAD(P)H-dependent oxidoreductase [Bacilli bacterium]